VRRGLVGSTLSSIDDAGRVSVTHLPAPSVTAVDVTGAGDAMTAAFVHALLRQDSPSDAARFGQMAAALTVASPDTVRPDLTPQLIDAELRTAKESATA
jgi:pseudouridine kinase